MWKEEKKSGLTTLSFSGWMEQKKDRGWMRFDGTVEAPIDQAINQEVQSGINNLNAAGGLQTTLNSQYYLGINKQYLIWGGVGVAVVVAAVIIYKKTRKK